MSGSAATPKRSSKSAARRGLSSRRSPFSTGCRSKGTGVLFDGLEGTLPIADVYPPVELEADLLEVSHFRKAEPLMQDDTGLVGQGNSGHESVDASGPKYREQLIIQPRSDASPRLAGVDVDGDLGRESIGAAGVPLGGIGIPDDPRVSLGDQPRQRHGFHVADPTSDF